MALGALPSALVDDLVGQRWFAAKGRAVAGSTVVDEIPLRLGLGAAEASLALVEVRFTEGPVETYLLLRPPDRLDALDDPRAGRALLGAVYNAARMDSVAGGTLACWRSDALHDVPLARVEPVRPLGAEQSNTSIRYGDALVLKMYRRLVPGLNPEIEVGSFLTEQTHFRQAPQLLGTLSYRAPDGAVYALGVLQSFVPSTGDLWQGILRRLEGLLADANDAEPARTFESAVQPLERLAKTTAEMHLALASHDDLPAFAPLPIGREDVDGWLQALEGDVAEIATEAGLDPGRIRTRLDGLYGLVGALKTRHHGDFHLGQVLESAEGGLTIVDFEGEPARPLAMRREKRSPLRDVAGLLRSVDYARHTALGERGDSTSVGRLDAWHTAARSTFMRTYLRAIHQGGLRLLPADDGNLRRALDALEVEKALYEVRYERHNRPHLARIPLAALR